MEHLRADADCGLALLGGPVGDAGFGADADAAGLFLFGDAGRGIPIFSFDAADATCAGDASPARPPPIAADAELRLDALDHAASPAHAAQPAFSPSAPATLDQLTDEDLMLLGSSLGGAGLDLDGFLDPPYAPQDDDMLGGYAGLDGALAGFDPASLAAFDPAALDPAALVDPAHLHASAPGAWPSPASSCAPCPAPSPPAAPFSFAFAPPSPSDSGESSSGSSQGTLVDDRAEAPRAQSRRPARAAAAPAAGPLKRALGAPTPRRAPAASPAPSPPIPAVLPAVPPSAAAALVPGALEAGAALAAETLRIIQGPERKKPGRKRRADDGAAGGAGAEGGARKRRAGEGAGACKAEPGAAPAAPAAAASAAAPPAPPKPVPRLDPSLLHTPNYDPAILDLDPATLPPADRKVLRLLKNRHSATLSRARRREKLAGLEVASLALAEENVALKKRAEEAEQRAERLGEECEGLRAALAAARAQLDAAGAGGAAGPVVPAAPASGRGRRSERSAVLLAVTLLGVAFLWAGMGEVAGRGAGGHGHHLAQVVPAASPALFELPASPGAAPEPAPLDTSRLLDPAVIRLGPAPGDAAAAAVKAEPADPGLAAAGYAFVPERALGAAPAQAPDTDPAPVSDAHLGLAGMFCEAGAPAPAEAALQVPAEAGMGEHEQGEFTILPLPTTPPTTLHLPSRAPFHLPPDAHLFADRVRAIAPLASPGPFPPQRPGGRPRMRLVAPAVEGGAAGGAAVLGEASGGRFVVIDFEVVGARVVAGR